METLTFNLGTFVNVSNLFYNVGTVLDADGSEELTEPEVCTFYCSIEIKCYSVAVNILLKLFCGTSGD